MSMNVKLLTSLLLTGFILPAVADTNLPEPGPADGGVRLRLVVNANPESSSEGYDVRLSLLSETNQPIKLQAQWPTDRESGSFKDYLESAVSIETFPPIAPWIGQIIAPHRTSPQPDYVLKPSEDLSLHWQTRGGRLKNKVTDPLSVQNPEFPTPGLYSVHATVCLKTANGEILLRSNEQLISVGNSHEAPKHTFGTLVAANADTRTARLNLGSLHKIEVGDRFEVRTGMTDFWTLTITNIERLSSQGSLEPMKQIGPNPTTPNPRFPERGASAKLIQGK